MELELEVNSRGTHGVHWCFLVDFAVANAGGGAEWQDFNNPDRSCVFPKDCDCLASAILTLSFIHS